MRDEAGRAPAATGAPVTRREALLGAGRAGTLALLGARAPALLAPPAAGLRVAGVAVALTATPVSAHTIRLRVAPLAGGRAVPTPNDGSLVDRDWDAPAVTLTELPATRTVRCGRFTLTVAADPLRVAVHDASGRPVQQLEVDTATGALGFAAGGAPLFGLGEGGRQFDRRGLAEPVRNGQDDSDLGTLGARVQVPWVVSPDGWALLVHHPRGSFDLRGPRGRFAAGHTPRSVAAAALPLDVFVVASHDPAVLMAEYAHLTGFPELPPLWAFGYQQSHRTVTSEAEVMEVARTFRERRLPCDALIYLGTGFAPSGWNDENGSFAFNAAVFPEPARVLGALHALHYRVVMHAVILAHTLRGRARDACALARYDETEAGCYWNLFRRPMALGVDAWWPDEGDPLDGAARLARIRMHWEGPQLVRPDERPYALHRNGYAGMQRYGGFLWSGDVHSTWETLREHVPLALNTGLSGIPWWGTDTGGFLPTAEFTGELFARWFQFSAFCPLFRSHGRQWRLRLPWGWETGEPGPNEMGRAIGALPPAGALRDPRIEPICRRYLELRYRLLPYLYSTARESHVTGLPMMRALWLHYPDDPAAVRRGDEYLWGRDLLVAPVTERGATGRTLYLPSGTWYDFWTEQPVAGGREVTRPVDLATLPLYARAGAIVPFGPLKQHTGERVEGPVTFVVYPGADGSCTLYEDDGISLGHHRGAWTATTVRWDDRARTLSFSRAPGSQPIAPRDFAVRVAPAAASRTVRFDGRRSAARL